MALEEFKDKIVQIAAGGSDPQVLFVLTDKGKVYATVYGFSNTDRHFFKEIKGVK